MYYIIFNPTAGAGRSKKVMQAVETQLKQKAVPYQITETKHQKHAALLAREAVGKGYSGILSVGGDGTLLEVAGALYNTSETLGVIPAGTGNDFRRAIGVPKDPIEALEVILGGYSQKVDIGILGDNLPFINVAGTGFDVEVIRNLEKVRRSFTGGFAYFLAILLTLCKHKSIDMTLTVNGEKLHRKVLLVAVANGKAFGGGLQVAPDADVTDGLFNVLIVNQVPRRRILIELPKLKKGRIKEISVSEQLTCSQIEIVADPPQYFEIDGDVIGQTPATLTVKPSALRVFCPRP